MEEITKAKIFFSRTQCNVAHGWFDKLKPYGFPIHGCVDGFSRRILWLPVTRSNNNPVVSASYYLETVSALKLCPTLLQTDCGTENNITAAIKLGILVRINMAPRHQTSE